MAYNAQILPMVGISRHYCPTIAQSFIVVPMLNGGTSAPLLAIYCWQQLIFKQ